MAFKDVLKELRTSRKLTQRELGLRLNISQNAISMYEQGRREPDMQTLTALADFFEVDMNYLSSSESRPAPIDPEQVELNRRDERDIGKKLRSMLELFDSEEALMFDGEPIDEETRELLKESYRNQLEVTKRLAKVKYNPNKNKKNN